MAKSYGVSKLDELHARATRKRSGSFPSIQFSGAMTENKMRFLSTRTVKFCKATARLFSHISTRAYGMSALSFGVVTLLLYFLKLSEDMSVITPILGAVITFLAIPFLLADQTLPLFLQDFKITDYIFFEFFCVKRANKLDTVSKFPLILSVLLGAAEALLGLVCPLWLVVVAFCAVIFVCITLLSPEFAFFASILLLPYMGFIPYSTVILSAIILLATFSFLRKSFFGKRVFYIDVYDLLIGLFMLTTLVSGIFIKGISSFTGALGMIFMGLGYTISNNVVTNRRLADRAANSIVISSVIPSVASIVIFVRAMILNIGTELIDKGIFCAFSNGEAASVFIIVSMLFSMALMLQSHGGKKAFYAIAFAIQSISLLLTGEAFAVLAVMLGILAYYFVSAKRGSAAMGSALVFVPYAALLLPDHILDRVFSFVPSLEGGAAELFALWGESLSTFVGNIVFGIGMGAESFVLEMADKGIISNNSSNLFIEIGLEAGIFALICFVLLLVVRLFHIAGYRSYVRVSDVSVLAPLCSACVLSIVAYGAVSYIFADIYAGYIFWCVFGIGSAALRVAKRETDDRNHYYEDTRASDSSAIDVEIR